MPTDAPRNQQNIEALEAILREEMVDDVRAHWLAENLAWRGVMVPSALSIEDVLLLCDTTTQQVYSGPAPDNAIGPEVWAETVRMRLAALARGGNAHIEARWPVERKDPP